MQNPLFGVGNADYGFLPNDRMAAFQNRGLTFRQWNGWKAYMKLFPLPHDRADINTALIRASVLASKGAKRVKAEKLIPQYGRCAVPQTEAELKAKIARWR